MHPPEYRIRTQPEAAKFLRVTTRHLQRLAERGEGPPCIRLGGRRVGYPEHGLIAWAEARIINPETETAA